MHIRASHNALATLLRQMDALPIKDFKQSRMLNAAYGEIAHEWGHDLSDPEELSKLNPADTEVLIISDEVAQYLKEVVETILNSGTVTGFGARLLLEIYDQLEEEE